MEVQRNSMGTEKLDGFYWVSNRMLKEITPHQDELRPQTQGFTQDSPTISAKFRRTDTSSH